MTVFCSKSLTLIWQAYFRRIYQCVHSCWRLKILLQVFRNISVAGITSVIWKLHSVFWSHVDETSIQVQVFPWEFINYILIFGVLISCVQCVIHVYSRWAFNWDALLEISQPTYHTTARNEIVISFYFFVPSCSIITSFMQNLGLIKIVVLRLMLILLFHVIDT